IDDDAFNVAITNTDLDVDVAFKARLQVGESRLIVKAELANATNVSPQERRLLDGELRNPRMVLWPLPDRLRALLRFSGGSQYPSSYRDGSAFVDFLPNGAYTVESGSSTLSRLQPDSYVSTARYAGTDVLNTPLIFDSAAPGQLDITFGF